MASRRKFTKIVGAITLIIIFFLIVLTIYLSRSLLSRQPTWEAEDQVIKVDQGFLTPAQVLKDKAKYNQKEIVLQGKVIQESVSCQRQDCPQDDSCCGCPSARNLILAQAGAVIGSQTEGNLRLLDKNGQAFCQRIPNSCNYDCADWQIGSIYQVGGTFFAEPPPPTWKLSLNYYFQVEAKKLEKNVSAGDTFSNIIQNLKDSLTKIKSSTYYTLP